MIAYIKVPEVAVGIPLEISEAVTMVAGIPDVEILEHRESGELKINISAEEGARRLAHFQKTMERLWQGLQSGALRALVQNPANGGFFIIPRFYWNRLTPFEAVSEPFRGFEASGYDEAMKGQPVALMVEDLERWAKIEGGASETGIASAEVASCHSSSRSKPGRGRPKGAGGFARLDEKLLEEMSSLIEAGEEASAWAAAGKVAPRGKGASIEAIQKRLAKAYNQRWSRKYPDIP